MRTHVLSPHARSHLHTCSHVCTGHTTGSEKPQLLGPRAWLRAVCTAGSRAGPFRKRQESAPHSAGRGAAGVPLTCAAVTGGTCPHTLRVRSPSLSAQQDVASAPGRRGGRAGGSGVFPCVGRACHPSQRCCLPAAGGGRQGAEVLVCRQVCSHTPKVPPCQWM